MDPVDTPPTSVDPQRAHMDPRKPTTDPPTEPYASNVVQWTPCGGPVDPWDSLSTPWTHGEHARTPTAQPLRIAADPPQNLVDPTGTQQTYRGPCGTTTDPLRILGKSYVPTNNPAEPFYLSVFLWLSCSLAFLLSYSLPLCSLSLFLCFLALILSFFCYFLVRKGCHVHAKAEGLSNHAKKNCVLTPLRWK